VYKRWCALGLLSSHSRLHGSNSYRVPWLFDQAGTIGPTASDVLRAYTKLKCRLMPYLYAAEVEAHESSVPTMRAMPLEFPDDPACDTLDRQYMLGERLLVALVFTPDGTVDYYLPTGRWTNFLSGEVVEGGRWLREQHGTLSLSLLVRPNTVLAVARAVVPALDGGVETTVEARREGARIEVLVQGPSQPWSVLLRGVGHGTFTEGGTAQQEDLGTRMVPDVGVRRVAIRLGV
jgi:alpha-D-xyloside xylohydrolase